MHENPNTESLFIGGSADGTRIAVAPGEAEHRISSVAEISDEPEALETLDPRPKRVPSVEIYQAIAVEHRGGRETAYALNMMTDEGIAAELLKHFGLDTKFSRAKAGG